MTTFLRRQKAAEYLKDKYGFGSEQTLAKLACHGGGPTFHKVGVIVLYDPTALDAWALSKMTRALRSTSDVAA